MKVQGSLILVMSCVVAVAVCAPPSEAQSKAYLRSQPALQNQAVHDENGQYAFRYVTAEGTVRSERGYLKTAANGKVIMVIEGDYQYVDDTGKVFSRKYKGDENGFHVDIDFKPVKGSLAYDSEAPLENVESSPAALESPKINESE